MAGFEVSTEDELLRKLTELDEMADALRATGGHE
jgi:hypothetical protein